MTKEPANPVYRGVISTLSSDIKKKNHRTYRRPSSVWSRGIPSVSSRQPPCSNRRIHTPWDLERSPCRLHWKSAIRRNEKKPIDESDSLLNNRCLLIFVQIARQSVFLGSIQTAIDIDSANTIYYSLDTKSDFRLLHRGRRRAVGKKEGTVSENAHQLWALILDQSIDRSFGALF